MQPEVLWLRSATGLQVKWNLGVCAVIGQLFTIVTELIAQVLSMLFFASSAA